MSAMRVVPSRISAGTFFWTMISFARAIYSLTVFDVRFVLLVFQRFERDFVDWSAVSSTYSRGALSQMQILTERTARLRVALEYGRNSLRGCFPRSDAKP